MKVAASIRSDIIEMSKTIGPNKLKNLTPAERKVVSLVVQNKSISKDQKYILDNLMDKRLTEIKTMGQPEPSSTMGRIKKGIQNTLGLSVRSTDLREQIKAAADKEPKRTPKKGEPTKLSEQAKRTEPKKTTEEANPKKTSQGSTQKPLQRASEFSIKSKSSKQTQTTTKTSEEPTEKQEKIARRPERLDKKSARLDKRAEKYPLGKKLTKELEEHEKYLSKVSEEIEAEFKNEPKGVGRQPNDEDLAFIKGLEEEVIGQTEESKLRAEFDDEYKAMEDHWTKESHLAAKERQDSTRELLEAGREQAKDMAKTLGNLRKIAETATKEGLRGQNIPIARNEIQSSLKETLRTSFFHTKPLFPLLSQNTLTSPNLRRGQSRIDELRQEVGKMVLPEDISVARRVLERIFSDDYQKGDIVLIPGGVFSRGASIDVENSNLG